MTKDETKRLEKRGVDAVSSFLAQNNYEILEENWVGEKSELSFDIIAADDKNIIHFIDVRTHRFDNIEEIENTPTETKKHSVYEAAVMGYLSDYDGPDCQVTVDKMDVYILRNNRAFLKNSLNILNGPAA